MTAQQTKTIRSINDQIEADCFIASQAAREVAELDELGVIIAVQVKIAEGRMDVARQMWLDYKRTKGN